MELVWTLFMLVVYYILILIYVNIVRINRKGVEPGFGSFQTNIFTILGNIFSGLFSFVILIANHLLSYWYIYLTGFFIVTIFGSAFTIYNQEIVTFIELAYENTLYPLIIQPLFLFFSLILSILDALVCIWNIFAGTSRIVTTEFINIAQECDAWDFNVVTTGLFNTADSIIRGGVSWLGSATLDDLDITSMVTNATFILDNSRELWRCECNMLAFATEFVTDRIVDYQLACFVDRGINYIWDIVRSLALGVFEYLGLISQILSVGFQEAVCDLTSDPNHEPSVIRPLSDLSLFWLHLFEWADNLWTLVLNTIFGFLNLPAFEDVVDLFNFNFMYPRVFAILGNYLAAYQNAFFAVIELVLHLDVLIFRAEYYSLTARPLMTSAFSYVYNASAITEEAFQMFNSPLMDIFGCLWKYSHDTFFKIVEALTVVVFNGWDWAARLFFPNPICTDTSGYFSNKSAITDPSVFIFDDEVIALLNESEAFADVILGCTTDFAELLDTNLNDLLDTKPLFTPLALAFNESIHVGVAATKLFGFVVRSLRSDSQTFLTNNTDFESRYLDLYEEMLYLASAYGNIIRNIATHDCPVHIPHVNYTGYPNTTIDLNCCAGNTLEAVIRLVADGFDFIMRSLIILFDGSIGSFGDRIVALFEPGGPADLSNRLIIHLEEILHGTACFISSFIRGIDEVLIDLGGPALFEEFFNCPGSNTTRAWFYLDEVIFYSTNSIIGLPFRFFDVIFDLIYMIFSSCVGSDIDETPCSLECLDSNSTVVNNCICRIVRDNYRMIVLPFVNAVISFVRLMSCIIPFDYFSETNVLDNIADTSEDLFGIGGTVENLICDAIDSLLAALDFIVTFFTEGLPGLLVSYWNIVLDFLNDTILGDIINWFSLVGNILNCIIATFYNAINNYDNLVEFLSSLLDIQDCFNDNNATATETCFDAFCYTITSKITNVLCYPDLLDGPCTCNFAGTLSTCCFPNGTSLAVLSNQHYSHCYDYGGSLVYGATDGTTFNGPLCSYVNYSSWNATQGACIFRALPAVPTTTVCKISNSSWCDARPYKQGFFLGKTCNDTAVASTAYSCETQVPSSRPALRGVSTSFARSVTNTNLIEQQCEQQYLFYINEPDNSSYKIMLENDYRNCIWSAKISALMNLFFFHNASSYISPYVLYNATESEMFLGNITRSIYTAYNYSLSNQTLNAYLNNSNITLEPLSQYSLAFTAALKNSRKSGLRSFFSILYQLAEGAYKFVTFLPGLIPNPNPVAQQRSSSTPQSVNYSALFYAIAYQTSRFVGGLFNATVSPVMQESLAIQTSYFQQYPSLGMPDMGGFHVVREMFSRRMQWHTNNHSDPLYEPYPRLLMVDRRRWENLYRYELTANTEEEVIYWQNARDTIYPYTTHGYLFPPPPSTIGNTIEPAIFGPVCSDLACYDDSGIIVGTCLESGTLQCNCFNNATVGACCTLGGECLETTNSSCILAGGLSWHPNSTCTWNNVTGNICDIPGLLLSGDYGACCYRYERKCEVTTEAACLAGDNIWNQGSSCTDTLLPEVCKICGNDFIPPIENFPPVDISDTFLCPLQDPNFVVTTPCTQRNCYGVTGNIAGTCYDDFDPIILNPICNCQLTTNTTACCFSNQTCSVYSNSSTCISNFGIPLVGETSCDACLTIINSTNAACCYGAVGNKSCSIMSYSDCALVSGTFNPNKSCRSPGLAGECDHCSAPGCRSCELLLRSLNDVVDLIFHCINNFISDTNDVINLPVSTMPTAVQYKDALSYRQQGYAKFQAVVDDDTILGFIINTSETVYNFVTSIWPFNREPINLSQTLDNFVAFILNDDPDDPNGLLYYVFFVLGIGCDVLESVDEDRGLPGWGIWTSFFFVLGVILAIYATISLANRGISSIFITLIIGFFVRYWLAFAFWFSPGCIGSLLIPVVTILPAPQWILPGHLVIGHGPISAVFGNYLNEGRWIRVYPNIPLLPENIATEVYDAFFFLNTPDLDLCPNSVRSTIDGQCPDCYEDPYRFRLFGLRNFFYILHANFPQVYCMFHDSFLTQFEYWKDAIQFDGIDSCSDGFTNYYISGDYHDCNIRTIYNIVPFAVLFLGSSFLVWLLWTFIISSLLVLINFLIIGILQIMVSLYSIFTPKNRNRYYLFDKEVQLKRNVPATPTTTTAAATAVPTTASRRRRVQSSQV